MILDHLSRAEKYFHIHSSFRHALGWRGPARPSVGRGVSASHPWAAIHSSRWGDS